MFIARRRGLTVTKIGRYLNRDHTTVVHGARAEQARRDQQ
jgi:chromosomal replication initiation ATPase DnaA